MTKKSIGRTGMVLVVVAVGLIFVTIFFATMIGRVRHETGLTARASINERLYQVASAIGRLTVRKLQRDFETYDQKSEDNIIDMVFNKKSKIKDVSYDDVIGNLDVVKRIKQEFESRWGDLDIKVKYSVEVPDKSDFPSYVPGLANSEFERRGYITADIVLTHRNHTKHCKISKQFFLTRLFAPPFHRFTFFMSNAASIAPTKLNRLEKCYDDGSVKDADPPLQLFNRRISGVNANNLDRVQYNPGSPPVVETAGDLNNNGWIYLGGTGNGGEGPLTLKIMSGSQGKMPDATSDTANQGKYGEYFHLYYTDQSLGWRGSQYWTQWLRDNRVPEANPPVMKACYVDYGFFSNISAVSPPNDIQSLEAPPGSGQALFWGFTPDKTRSSALHLFGTPSCCTPTLVFGNVKRQYLRIWSLLFGGNVWPITSYATKESYSGMKNSIDSWLDTLPGSYVESKQALDTIFSPDPVTNVPKLDYQTYLKYFCPGFHPASSNPESYMKSIVNLAKPSTVQDWKSIDAIQQNEYLRNSPDDVCKTDYEFKDDQHLHYSGRINSIKVDSKYFDALKQRTSYYITQKPKTGTTLKLSECDFFKNTFFVPTDGMPPGENNCYLGQIVGFESSIEIDVPLVMSKGGIIWTKKNIEISKPIINPYIYNNYPINTAEHFGWLTLVSEQNIRINANPNMIPPGPGGGHPELHAFLVACNGGSSEIDPTSKIHLIGGVAADKMDRLIEKGGIIEWGFMKGELSGQSSSGKTDMTSEDFHGISMGPLDGEYVYEQ